MRDQTTERVGRRQSRRTTLKQMGVLTGGGVVLRNHRLGSSQRAINQRAADSWKLAQQVIPSDGEARDQFGSSVALDADGTTALVGAPHPDRSNGEKKPGLTYVYQTLDGEWTQTTELVPDDANPGNEGGEAVALDADGTTALVGCSRQRGGAVYVFRHIGGEWTQTGKLISEDRNGRDRFGTSVSLNATGTRALVGAFGNNTGRGGAYVFDLGDQGWRQSKKLIARDRSLGDLFGVDVVLDRSGTTALVGATGVGDDEGAAYLFQSIEGEWTRRQKLTARRRQSGERFGQGLAINTRTNTILVGAPIRDTDSGDSAGVVYVFKPVNGHWEEVQVLRASDGGPSDEFGVAIALDEEASVAVISAPTGGTGIGSAYAFRVSGGRWIETGRFVPNDVGERARFGSSIALDAAGTTALVGAERESTSNGLLSGATYLFEGPSNPDIPATNPLKVGNRRYQPRDLDGDGLFEDVNGDLTLDFDDVSSLARIYRAHKRGNLQLTKEQRAGFDFNHDGKFTHSDVVGLSLYVIYRRALGRNPP